MKLAEAEAALRAAVARGEVPGAMALTGDANTVWPVVACGVTRLGGPSVSVATRYDLASLTKVVGTLSAVLALVQAGAVSLDDPVRRFFSGAGWSQTPSLGDATVRQLLTHTSGLPAWTPIFAVAGARLTALGNLLQTPLAHPVGRVVYSDLGFMLLGALVERVSGERLSVSVQTRVFGPLGMTATAYGMPEGAVVAATEDCGWRGRLLEGEVHDENAAVFEGVAGHAGLFGTAGDLARYAQAWLRLQAPFAAAALLREATREQAAGDGMRRGFGWQLSGEGGARVTGSDALPTATPVLPAPASGSTLCGGGLRCC